MVLQMGTAQWIFYIAEGVGLSINSQLFSRYLGFFFGSIYKVQFFKMKSLTCAVGHNAMYVTKMYKQSDMRIVANMASALEEPHLIYTL